MIGPSVLSSRRMASKSASCSPEGGILGLDDIDECLSRSSCQEYEFAKC